MKMLFNLLIVIILVSCSGILREEVKIEGTINVFQKDFFYKKEFNSFIKFLEKDSALVLKIGEEIFDIVIENNSVRIEDLEGGLQKCEEIKYNSKRLYIKGYKCSRESLGQNSNYTIDYLSFYPLYRGGDFEYYLRIYNGKSIDQFFKLESESFKKIRVHDMHLYNGFIVFKYNGNCIKDKCNGMIGILSVEELINKIPKDGSE